MNRLSAALATVAVLALAGCGGSATSAGPVSSPAASQTTSTPEPVAVPKASYGTLVELRDAAIAAGYPCPTWTQDNAVVFAAESGSCSEDDVFMTYASAGQLEEAVSTRKAMNKMLTEKNIEAGPTLVGENWTINTDSAFDLQAELGGTILR